MLYAGQDFSSRANILGPQVLSMVKFLVELSQAMDSSCIKGIQDAAPKQAPSCAVFFSSVFASIS
jgi:hypothetical protein